MEYTITEVINFTLYLGWCAYEWEMRAFMEWIDEILNNLQLKNCSKKIKNDSTVPPERIATAYNTSSFGTTFDISAIIFQYVKFYPLNLIGIAVPFLCTIRMYLFYFLLKYWPKSTTPAKNKALYKTLYIAYINNEDELYCMHRPIVILL